ncbi:hypothetical protein MMC30_004129 [Trapelia coarctata]|nr:hypothetical protein [Trapelia coarctata]
MASIMKGGWGKKKPGSTATPEATLAPPSYETRPPKGHKTTEKGYQDSEDDNDGEESAQPNRPQRNRAGPSKPAKQTLREDLSEEEYDARDKKGKSRPRQYDNESEDEIEPRGKGKGKAKRNQRDDNDDERGHRREDISRAVVRRNKSPSEEDYRLRPKPTKGGRRKESGSSDEESADYLDRGRDGRRNKSKSQALTRAGGRSKSHKYREDDDEDDERITVERYRNVDIQELSEDMIGSIQGIFSISSVKLESFCERGKIRYDNKTSKLNLDKLFPCFPDYVRSRWEDVQEEMKIEEQDSRDRRGRLTTNTMNRGLDLASNLGLASVSLYDPPAIGVVERFCYGDRSCLSGKCRFCCGTGVKLFLAAIDDEPF